jgi:CHAT domain-containing protein/Tfp pilus assembly protein PilF
VHRLRLGIALVCAGTAIVCLCLPAQESGEDKSSVSSVAEAGTPAQLKDLLGQCDEELNVHGNYVRAVELARQSQQLSQKLGDKRSEAHALVLLAAALSYQGKVNESLEVAQQTLLVARESGDKREIEQALNNLGGITGGMGRLEQSVGYFYECFDLAREINDPVMRYMSLLNLGEAYALSGEPELAENPLQQALKMAGELDHGDATSKAKAKKGKEMALSYLADNAMTRRRFADALRYYEAVHASQPQTPLWAIGALEGMASAYQSLEKPKEAIPLFEEALALAEKSPGTFQVAHIMSNLGTSQAAVGQLDAALNSQERSLDMVRTDGAWTEEEWQIQSRMGHVLRAMGRKNEALQHYQEAIAGIERLRSVALNTEGGRAGLMVFTHDTYAETADLLVEMHRNNDAFAMAERGRARAFLEMLAISREGLPNDLTPEQASREKTLLAQISSAQKDLWKAGLSAKEQEDRKAKLTSAEEDLESFQVEIRRLNPRYASIRYPEPINISQVQHELLDDKTVLLEFLLGQKRSLVWALSRDQVTVKILPSREQIEQQVSDYRKLLSDKASVLTLRQSLEGIDRAGSALYATLLAPVRDTIPTGEKLVVIPDGALDYLPFETLVTATKRDATGQSLPMYALERFSISYGPSASALLALRAMNPEKNEWSKSLLAFGDPVLELGIAKRMRTALAVRSAGGDAAETVERRKSPTEYDRYAERGFSLARLPFTREEVLSIGRLFPASQRQLYLGESATEQAVRNENLGQYRYIHFATHGFLDETAPGRSGILFSPTPASQGPGVLQSGEIMRLKMHADLVTLSACSTGLGEMVDGEGILGLTRAFFYAGARNLTVSLWNVNDSATSALMRAFYARLNRGATKADALREAKLQLLRSSNPAWRNPYFWGAFVMVGEGK